MTRGRTEGTVLVCRTGAHIRMMIVCAVRSVQFTCWWYANGNM